MLSAYAESGFIGESSGAKIDRLKSEAAGLEPKILAAGREDPRRAFELETERTQKLNEAKRLEIELNERAAELGERQNEIRIEALAPAEQLKERAAELARIEEQIAATSATTAAGMERLVDLENKRLDAKGQVRDMQAEMVEKDLGAFFGDMDKKSADFFSATKDGAKDAKNAARELGMTFSSAFEDAVLEGKGLSDVLKGIEQDILRIILRRQVTEPLADSISGMFSEKGSKGGGLLGGIGSIFSGLFLANGGRPPVGRASVVGEEGPELFVPDSSGTIISNSRLAKAVGSGGTGGGVAIVQHLHFEAGVSQSQLAEGLRQTYEASKAGVMDAIHRRRGGFGALRA